MIETRVRELRIVGTAMFGIALGLSLTPSVALAEQVKLAVVPTQFDETARGMVPELFDDYLLTAVQNISADFQVIGQDDISALIGFEAQKDMLDCSDASCMADIGGALGVDKIVIVKIARLGEDWVVTAKIINIKKTMVENRLNHMIAGDVKALLQSVPELIGKLFGASRGSAPVPATPKPPPKAETPATPKPPPTARTTAATSGPAATVKAKSGGGGISVVIPILTMIAGAGAISAGVVFGIMAKSDESCANRVDPESPCPGGQVSIQTANDNALLANVMYIAGGVVTAVGVGLFFFTGGDDEKSAAITPVFGPDSLGLAFSGRF